MKALTPEKICEMAGLCQPKVIRALALAAAQATPESSACEGCKALLAELKQALADPTTAEVLVAALAASCAASGPYADVCKLVVAQLAEDNKLGELLLRLSEAIAPGPACHALHLCKVDDVLA